MAINDPAANVRNPTMTSVPPMIAQSATAKAHLGDQTDQFGPIPDERVADALDGLGVELCLPPDLIPGVGRAADRSAQSRELCAGGHLVALNARTSL